MKFQHFLLFLLAVSSVVAEEPWGKDADLLYPHPPRCNACQEQSIPVQISTALIRFHQEVISPCDGPRSHFRPSSSQYTLEAIQKYGFIAGVPIGCDRLMRENNDPWIYRTTIDEQGNKIKWDPLR